MVEARLNSRIHSRRTRRPARARMNWSGVLAATLFAGSAMLLVLLVLSTAVYDESPWKLLRMMAATVRGPAVLSPEGQFDLGLVGIGLSIHYGLALLYAAALAGVLADFRRAYAPWLGIGFGIALYFANLYGFTHLFPWFAELRTIDTLLAHAFFGLLLARFVIR